MKSLPRLIVIILLLLLAFIAYSELKKTHSFTEYECYRCHKRPYDDPAALVDKPVTEMCVPCHRMIVKTSTHPVGIRPVKTRIPSDLPLRDGKITCATCHDIHAQKDEIFGFRTYQLRRPSSDVRFFCLACHETDISSSGHAETTNVAHVGRYYRKKDSGTDIDELSHQCISCHDDTFAVSVKYQVGAGDWEHGFGLHPIGIDYREAAMRNVRLAPLERVDRRIQLFNRKIGCGTCHDMFSDRPGKLVMSNSGSRLCRECHYQY